MFNPLKILAPTLFPGKVPSCLFHKVRGRQQFHCKLMKSQLIRRHGINVRLCLL